MPLIRLLRQLRTDPLAGENLEIYTTALLSLVLAVLGVLGTVGGEVLAAATLATLALLASGMLGGRRQVAKLTAEVRARGKGELSVEDFLGKGKADRVRAGRQGWRAGRARRWTRPESPVFSPICVCAMVVGVVCAARGSPSLRAAPAWWCGHAWEGSGPDLGGIEGPAVHGGASPRGCARPPPGLWTGLVHSKRDGPPP